MKTRTFTLLTATCSLLIVLLFALASCKDPEDTAAVQPDTPRDLSWGGKVTIKSSDAFTDAEWETLCDKVVAAINAAYTNTTGKSYFNTVFASGQNAKVVLVNNLSHNYEVKSEEFRTLYLKTASIDSADYVDAVAYMEADYPAVGQAAPIKNNAEYLAELSRSRKGDRYQKS